MDNESGLARSEAAKRYFARKGIQLQTRGKEQHAPHIERRGALLRDTIHKIESQIKEEGLTVPFASILADAVLDRKSTRLNSSHT